MRGYFHTRWGSALPAVFLSVSLITSFPYHRRPFFFFLSSFRSPSINPPCPGLFAFEALLLLPHFPFILVFLSCPDWTFFVTFPPPRVYRFLKKLVNSIVLDTSFSSSTHFFFSVLRPHPPPEAPLCLQPHPVGFFVQWVSPSTTDPSLVCLSPLLSLSSLFLL